MCRTCFSLLISNTACTRCDQKVSRQYFILNDNSIYFVVHADLFKVVPLLHDTVSPVIVSSLQVFLIFFCSELWKYILQFFLNHADSVESPVLQCQLCVNSEERSWRLLDLGSIEGAEQQSHNYWWDILSYTKQGEQNHCNGRKTNLQCTTCQVVFTAHLPIDIIEHLHRSIVSQFVRVDFTHNDEHFCAFWKKWTACTSHSDKLSGLRQVRRWWILPWRILWLCFIVVPVNLMFHYHLWSLKEMMGLFVVFP